MSRLLVTNISKCGTECVFLKSGFRFHGEDMRKPFCMLVDKEIDKIEADGFPEFCGLEKVIELKKGEK